jgi:hypothetical protein
VAKDAEQRMAVPIAAFHPMLGQLTVNMDVPVERQEKLSSTQGSDSQIRMVSSDGLLVSTVSVESGGTGGKEEALMGNNEQYVVHGADGPFLMNKNKWPNLSLPIEQDAQS